MSSTIGNRVRLSIFGESHGEAIGCVLDGLPAGEPLCMEEILRQMDRRAPGRDQTATTRRESDVPRLVSGVLNGRTTGAPLAMIIQNENQRSGDYGNLTRLPRPAMRIIPAMCGTTGITISGAAAISAAASPRRWCAPALSAARFWSGAVLRWALTSCGSRMWRTPASTR